MTTIESLAEFVNGVQVNAGPASLGENVRLHLFDTLVASLAGAKTPEARAIAAMAAEAMAPGEVPVAGMQLSTSPAMAALISCVATRCTEIDDIHISSCTTIGSVIVPTAMALSYRRPQIKASEFLAALLAGYEVMTRFGKAANGPFILYKGIWPTYFASALGATATAARMLGLTREQTAHALAAAITLTNGTSVRINGLSSRWLTLGCSVQNAIMTALAARQGYRGGLEILGGESASVMGVDIDLNTLRADLGKDYETERVSIKPYCAAKQTTSALCAFLNLLDRELIDPLSIERIVVTVPTYYSKMIDHPEPPRDVIGSIVSIQYQLALAAFYRDQLTDIYREPLHNQPEFRALMGKVKVEVDTNLNEFYPTLWPAIVEVCTAKGTSVQEVRYAKGDALNPFTWPEIIEKARRVLGRPTDHAGLVNLERACRKLGSGVGVSELHAALKELS